MNILYRLYQCTLILCLWITFASNAQEEERKELFLQCWQEYIKEYITKNKIKIDPTTGGSPEEQWNRNFILFTKRLEKVKPIYKKWQEYKKTKINNRPKTEDPTWSHGGGHWLLVFLGLKPRYEYRIDNNTFEVNFVQKQLKNISWVKEYAMTDESEKFPRVKTVLEDYKIREDNCFNIKVVKNNFFKKEFVVRSMQDKNDVDFGGALYYGLTPDLFDSIGGFNSAVDTEEKKITTKEFTINNRKLSNSCCLLIPGVAVISYQTPYTILYGRLIQYALVYLESLAYYKLILLKKLQDKTMYKNSWLSQKYPYFYQNPLIYDEIYKKYEKIRIDRNLKEDENLKQPYTELKNIYNLYKNPEKIIPKMNPGIQISSLGRLQKQSIFSRIKNWWWNRFFGN